MNTTQHYHFIGIGGTGLSAIARVLHERGEIVSGSDRSESMLGTKLKNAGIQVVIGHAADNVNGATVVIRSSAVPEDNVEVTAAKALGIPVLKRSDFLEQLTTGKVTVAIAGTHGKTTNTSMTAWVLTMLGADPTFIVGGEIENLKTNAHAGKGSHFVIEADEYDHMFLGLTPDIAVITNVEHDHPDCFPTEADFFQAFSDFVRRIKPEGTLVLCVDDQGAVKIGEVAKKENIKIVTYGFAENAEYQAVKLKIKEGVGTSFQILHKGEMVAKQTILVPGRINVQNALAAFVVAHQLGYKVKDIKQGLAVFRGARRRFDIRGEARGVVVIDDYGHHPTAIQKTLEAARERYPGRELWAVWQPHTYTRTNMLFEAFQGCFDAADQVCVTDVFAARESIPSGFTIARLVETMPHDRAVHVGDLELMTQYLLAHLPTNAVLVVFSAGDGIRISERVIAELEAKEAVR